MSRVTSKDGTSIAYDRHGSGPAVILVGGGLVDPATGRAGRSENAPLARELAEHFTVYNYDRRGRGDSGDTLPYALEREIEDLEALITEAGGSAHLYGVSSGGALVLEAAAAGIAADRLAMYEVPGGHGRGRRPVRAGRGRDRREHPAGGTSDHRRPDPRGRPEGARSDPRTILQRRREVMNHGRMGADRG